MSIAKQLRKGVFYRVDDNQIVDIQVTEELMKNAACFIDQLIYECEALKAKIDGGVRMYVNPKIIFCREITIKDAIDSMCNVTLIFDEGTNL